MVNVVDRSFNNHGYRETNLQLARENGELRQQLSNAIAEDARKTEEIHRKDVQLNNLRTQINELLDIKERYNSIISYVLSKASYENLQLALEGQSKKNQDEILAITHSTSIQKSSSTTFSLSDAHNESQSDSITTLQNAQHATSAESPDEEIDDSIVEGADSESTCSAQYLLDRISEDSEEEQNSTIKTSDRSYSDSLDLPNVTSVPPLRLIPDRTPVTPSVFNCLDTIHKSDDNSISNLVLEETLTSQNRNETSIESTSTKLDDNNNSSRHSTVSENQQEIDQSNIASKPNICTFGGASLRTSNVNSTSPIQPVCHKESVNINHDMYQSTPVVKKKNPINNHRQPQCVLKRRSTADADEVKGLFSATDNQENMKNIASTKGVVDDQQTVKPKPIQKKRQPAAKRAIPTQGPEPARYNLRKRTKL